MWCLGARLMQGAARGAHAPSPALGTAAQNLVTLPLPFSWRSKGKASVSTAPAPVSGAQLPSNSSRLCPPPQALLLGEK